MAGFRKTRRAGRVRTHVCHNLRLPTGAQRLRLSAALGQPIQPAQPRQAGRLALPEPESQAVFWTVQRRALPPAKISAPALPDAPEQGPESTARPVRDARERPADQAAAQRAQITQLERRLAKLVGMLDARDAEVAQLRASEPEDTGYASTYREIQGIAADDAQSEAKKEMMSLLFQANLKLHRGISSQTPSGD